MKIWEANFNGNKILVTNTINIECLYVNGALQDKTLGMKSHTRLFGNLPTGEPIKVSLGESGFTLDCVVFVDNKLVETRVLTKEEIKKFESR